MGIRKGNHRCAFCEEYKNAYAMTKRDREKGRKVYLQVKLFEYIARMGGKEYSSKTHRPMKLRFCPSCGVELSRD